jgi:hypothetical protein
MMRTLVGRGMRSHAKLTYFRLDKPPRGHESGEAIPLTIAPRKPTGSPAPGDRKALRT